MLFPIEDSISTSTPAEGLTELTIQNNTEADMVFSLSLKEGQVSIILASKWYSRKSEVWQSSSEIFKEYKRENYDCKFSIYIRYRIWGAFSMSSSTVCHWKEHFAKGRSMPRPAAMSLTSVELDSGCEMIIMQGALNASTARSRFHRVISLWSSWRVCSDGLLSDLQDQPRMVVSACSLVSLCPIIAYIDFWYSVHLWLGSAGFLKAAWLCYVFYQWVQLNCFSLLVGAGFIYFGAKAYKKEVFDGEDSLYLAALSSWFSPLNTLIWDMVLFF